MPERTDHNEAMRLADSIKTRAVGWTEWRVENPVDGGYVMVFTQAESLRPEKEAKEWLELHKQHHPNSMYADYVVAKHHCYSRVEQDALDAAALLRQQAERIAELEKELQATSGKLQDLQSLFDYVKERRAQISHRLWVWAHEELTEPLKTRYFNIVANGTADVMEQPTYAQQYNGQKHRAEAAEAERDQLRAEVERLRAVVLRMAAGIDHLSEIARQWEPDHSSGADRRGWLLAKDARDDALKLLKEHTAAIDQLRTKP